MIDYNQMPQRTINNKKREIIFNDIRRAVIFVQDAVRNLAGEGNIKIPASVSVNDWKTALQESDTRLGKARQSIIEDDGLAEAEKLQKLSAWRGWHKRIATAINVITRNLENYPQAGWKYDEVQATIIPTADIEAVADEAAIVDVPEDAKAHAQLICAVMESITRLRQFEHEKNVAKIRLEQLCALDGDSLAGLWADGSIKRPVISATDPWTRSAASQREFLEKMYL